MALAPQKCVWSKTSNYQPYLSLGLQFLSVDGKGKLVLAIRKIQKMALATQKCALEEILQLLTAPKFGTRKICVDHYEKSQKWL